jgi:hypothetical protein
VTDDADVTALALAQIPEVKIRRGAYVGIDPVSLLALVDLGDSRFPCGFGGVIPELNEVVSVLSVGPQHLMFPVSAKPGEGVVASVAAPLATVTTSIGAVVARYVGSAPTVGQRVALIWSEGPKIVGVLAAAAVLPDVPPDPAPGTTTRTATFRARQAGSTDRGSVRWWSASPQAGNSTYGAWFYGTAIRDTIPSSATLVSLQFKVNRTQDQGGDPRFTLHSDAVKSGIPSMSAYDEWDPAQGWQTPPMAAAWFSALKGGGSRLGVGLNQGGYNIFASLAQDSESGALRISWKE